MAENMKGIIKMIRKKGFEFILGRLGKSMLANGKMENKMVGSQMEKLELEYGLKEKESNGLNK